MIEFTAIDVGLTGAALARCVHRTGHALMVWNHLPAPMRPFAELDAAPARVLPSAIAAGPAMLICTGALAATIGRGPRTARDCSHP